jgi:hypothetical protein
LAPSQNTTMAVMRLQDFKNFNFLLPKKLNCSWSRPWGFHETFSLRKRMRVPATPWPLIFC